jgi:lysophospholipase L1-like esterase
VKRRVRFSTFGSGGLVIGAAHIARGATASITPGTDRTLTFGGYTSIAIPPGAVVVSDPLELNVADRDDLAVSIFVPGITGPASWHFDGQQTSFISPSGDFTASATMPPGTVTTFSRFWLAGVEVVASKQTGAIVALGDSLVESSFATPNANARWTDQLAKRLLAQPGNHAMGMLNEGIVGNRLLHDSLGSNGLARFDRDVLAQTGVTHVIVVLGLGDIFSGPVLNPAEEVTVAQMIQGYRQLIERAHTKGLKIFGAALTPLEGFLVPGTPFPVFTLAREAKRIAINDWIRSSGEFDAVIDFDLVLRDPLFPTRIRPTFDSGDHAHPNDLGYAAMANAIDLKLFK